MHRFLSAVALGLAAAASAARAGDSAPRPNGPEIGNLRYRAELKTTPQGEDADDFAGVLAAGERLSVKVTVPLGSGLYPTIRVLGPDGAETPGVPVRSGPSGRSAEIRNWPVPATGRWTVRVLGVLGTSGRYACAMRVRSAEPFRVEAPATEDGGPAAADLRFDALAGSRVDLVAVGGQRTSPRLVAVRDPAGADVPGKEGAAVTESRVRGRTVTLRIDSIAAGDGEYVAHFAADAAPGGFTATARVTSPRRASGSRRLGGDEPLLDAPRMAIRGTTDREIRLTGRYLSVAPAPTVLFGGVPAISVLTDDYGGGLTVQPPVLPEGSLSRIDVINPDGQFAVLEDAFYYVPTPVFVDLVDDDGAPVRGATTQALAVPRVLHLIGANFEPGVFVRFGDGPDVLPYNLTSGRMDVPLPAQAAGVVPVRLIDTYGHDVASPFDFEFRDAPVLAAVPYFFGLANPDGSLPVLVQGSGFAPGDTVLLGGVPTATEYLSDAFLRIVLDPAFTGPASVVVEDVYGGRTSGPAISRP